MIEGRAIYVPGHGLPESVRAVRFVNRSPDAEPINGHASRSGPPDPATTIEVVPGNYYGDLDGSPVASRSVTDRAEIVFSETEAPRIEPERSLVVLVHNSPQRWEVEFESVVAPASGRTGFFRITIDNFGTAREALPGRPSAANVEPMLTHAM